MTQAINKLKSMLLWSDRIGSDEISEINDIIKLLEKSHIKQHIENKKIIYTKETMENAFKAGGSLHFDFDFNTFLDKYINQKTGN